MSGPEFVVLTGFLGSGKTTLLRDFIGTAEAADTAVIVNEVGEIGLDGALLREAGGDVALTTLASGCICCQLGTDLTLTVEALLAADRPAGAPPLRRIVLETSGISKPGPILRQLAALGAYRMRVAVVATYDATRGADVRDFEEAAAQWAGAHRIVITKPDLVGARSWETARFVAGAINPLAEIVAADERDERMRRTFAPPQASTRLATPSSEEPGSVHPRLTTTLLRQHGILAYGDLAAWLDNVAGALGDRLLRVKGLLQVTECPDLLLVQSVGTLFAAPRPFSAPAPLSEPFLVVIARDLKPGEIEALTASVPLSPARSAGRRARSRRRPARAEAV